MLKFFFAQSVGLNKEMQDSKNSIKIFWQQAFVFQLSTVVSLPCTEYFMATDFSHRAIGLSSKTVHQKLYLHHFVKYAK